MPLENLGLVILDEEHEPSYKAENFPPYHAAEIAKMRAAISGASVVLASATPLVEDYAKAEMGIDVYKRQGLNPYRLISSGSLLIAQPGNPEALLKEMHQAGICAAVIGEFLEQGIVDAQGRPIAPPVQDELYNALH